MVARAIAFATKAHEGQFRKGTKRPYIVHPLEVGEIVATLTFDEEIISAALLHDTIEDCQGITREVLAQEFSERVAALVAQESEDKSKTWFERKSHTIEHLKYAPYEVRMIGLADKLSNIRDIDRDYPVIEEASRYFRIGENKLRRLAEENKDAGWLIMNGNRIQIKRRQFEKVIDKLDAI